MRGSTFLALFLGFFISVNEEIIDGVANQARDGPVTPSAPASVKNIIWRIPHHAGLSRGPLRLCLPGRELERFA